LPVKNYYHDCMEFTCYKDNLPVTKSLPIFWAPYYFSARGDLSLLYAEEPLIFYGPAHPKQQVNSFLIS